MGLVAWEGDELGWHGLDEIVGVLRLSSCYEIETESTRTDQIKKEKKDSHRINCTLSIIVRFCQFLIHPLGITFVRVV